MFDRDRLAARFSSEAVSQLPLHLSVGDVAENILFAHEAGTLQCDLASDGDEARCSYGSDGPDGPNTICCAIGASVPPDLRPVFDNWLGAGTGIGSLIQSGAVTTQDEHILQQLQNLHDRATKHAGRASADIYRAALLAVAAVLCDRDPTIPVDEIAGNHR